MLRSIVIIALIATVYFPINVNSLNNGLARTPPMGWMTWQRFRCVVDCVKYPNDCISEALVKRTADAMVREGYLDAGYEYLVIDDCWTEFDRSDDGKLVPNQERFPSGMKALGDYIHSLGLKFGIYGDYGTKTCAGYPGSIEHEVTDANTFAEWGVDYLKLDGCYADIHVMNEGYSNFSRYLNETGRPIVFSCSLPVYQEENGLMPNFTLIKEICNLWRNYDDIDDAQASVEHIVKYFIEAQDRIQSFAGPGHWNDPDMLLIGNYGLSIEQSKSQMAIWAILAAPLLMSADMDDIRPEFKAILLNKDVIKVNQDRLGIQGIRLRRINNIDIWIRPITPVRIEKNEYDTYNEVDLSYAIAFVSNRVDGYPYQIQVNLGELGLMYEHGYIPQDLYNGGNAFDDIVYPRTNITVYVKPSGCVFYKFTIL